MSEMPQIHVHGEWIYVDPEPAMGLILDLNMAIAPFTSARLQLRRLPHLPSPQEVWAVHIPDHDGFQKRKAMMAMGREMRLYQIDTIIGDLHRRLHAIEESLATLTSELRALHAYGGAPVFRTDPGIAAAVTKLAQTINPASPVLSMDQEDHK